jgi:hypothetical protein
MEEKTQYEKFDLSIKYKPVKPLENKIEDAYKFHF